MFKTKYTEAKSTPRKKTVTLENIAVSPLVFVDSETGENITNDVIAEFPDGTESISFKLVFELDEEM